TTPQPAAASSRLWPELPEDAPDAFRAAWRGRLARSGRGRPGAPRDIRADDDARRREILEAVRRSRSRRARQGACDAALDARTVNLLFRRLARATPEPQTELDYRSE